MKCKLVNENYEKDYVDKLLKHRGIEDINAFKNPTEKDLNDPKLFTNIEKGSKLLLDKIKEKKTLGLIVDCDTDGYTSAAIIYKYIKAISPDTNIEYYLHSGKQHGLEDMINKIIDKDYGLVILPDSSSNDGNYHDKLNFPCLILDHHLSDGPFSNNAIIINNQLSENYPNKELTGAGVTWQFCRYLDNLLGYSYADDLIDLAALGIIGDMGGMNIIENQYIISKGLKNVKNDMFWALLYKQSYSITKEMGVTDQEILQVLDPTAVAFYIVPLINAMIRVGKQEEKERLFMGFIDGLHEIESHKRGANGAMVVVSEESARECGNARNKQNRIKEQAIDQLSVRIMEEGLASNKILFVELGEEDNFPSELTGLIAMQLVAKYGKPTLVGRKGADGVVKGSIRGMNDSALPSLKDYLQSTTLFNYVEGHDNAAGYAIREASVYSFINQSNEELKDVDFGETYYSVNYSCPYVDSSLGQNILDVGYNEHLWGSKNPEPIFHVYDITLNKEDISIMGKNKNTIKFKLNGVEYIKFFAKDFIEDVMNSGDIISIELVGKCSINSWMGVETPQIIIQDYEISDGSLSF